MAKKDVMNVHGYSFPTVNLDFSVGARVENRPADVMLIQSLFRYIAVDPGFGKNRLGLDIAQVPKIDGVCGAVTLRAIRHFQYRNAHRLLRVDGVIHPASYKGRIIKDFQKPVMAITLLQSYANDMIPNWDDNELIPGLIRLEPRLGPFLK